MEELQERNLLEFHGEHYDTYRRRVPMLIPFFSRNESVPASVGGAAPTPAVEDAVL